jgi:septum formation protein
MRIILGSQSPRRREILEFFAIPFLQISSGFDEDSVPFKGDPAQHAMLLSQKKSEALVSQFPTDLILTADSVVYCDGKLYNKPSDEHEAASFLQNFSGKWQSVMTGVTVRRGDEIYTASEETKLLLNTLTPQQIQKFHTHCYFLDKAGGYAIEKSGSLILSRIEGCYYNVMGLPVNTVQKLLLKLGVDLWQYLKSFA